MRFSFYVIFSFLFFLYQSFIFIQVAWSHENWSAVEVRSFSEALKAAGVSDESISILIEATDYPQIKKINSFFQNLKEVDQQESKNSTAAEEFSDYVFNQNIDVDAIMGEDWIDELMGNTKDWTPIEANHFISFLKSEELEFDDILKILKATDYLRVIRVNQTFLVLEKEIAEQASTEVVQVHQQTEETSSQTQTASDVFIHFAREQFRKELEQEGKILEGEEFEDAFKKRMGSKGEWERKIAESTTILMWTVRDAKNFQNFLIERIGESATLKAMKMTSFFRHTGYENFILRFNIFSDYVDEEGMAEQLKRCLTCFVEGRPDVIRDVIEVVKEYFEEEGETIVKEAINNNIVVFALSENQSKVLMEYLHFLEGYIGKESIKDIILNKPTSFKRFRVKTQKDHDDFGETYVLQMPLIVEYLESYIEREAVQEVMRNSFQGFVSAERGRLRAVIEYIEEYFGDKGRAVVQGLMKNNFYGLAIAEFEKLKAVVEYLENYFGNEGKAVAQELMIKSFYGFARAEVEKLKGIVEYIEKYFEVEGKAVVQEIIRNSFQAFALADLERLRAVVEYIENYFENKEESKMIVRGIIKKSFKGFSIAELEKLKKIVRYIERYFGDEGKAIVQMIMIKGFQGLARAELEKLQKVLRYVEKYFGDRAVVQELIKRSFTGFAVAESKRLKTVVEYIENYFENKKEGKAVVQMIMIKGFEGLAIAELEKLREVVEYIEGYFESKELGQKAVRKLIQNNFRSLAVAERERLQEVVEYIEGYFENKELGQKAVRKIMQKNFYGLAMADIEKLKTVVGYIEEYIEKGNKREMAIKEIITSVHLFSKDAHFDEQKTSSLVFNKLNNLLELIDESIQSTNYDRQKREIWKTRLQDVFLDFSIESLEKLHQDINEDTCEGALS